MKKLILSTIFILSCSNFGFILMDNKKNNVYSGSEEVIPNMIVVKLKFSQNRLYKNDNDALNFNKLLTYYNVYSLEKMFPNKQEPVTINSNSVDLSRLYYVKYNNDISPYEAAKAFSKNPLVEYAEPAVICYTDYSTNDPCLYNQQWSLEKISAIKAWDITKGSKEVVIGIVDSGVDWTHPDLAANIWINKNEIPNNGIDDDHNGYIDDVRGWDFGGLGDGKTFTPDNDPNEDLPEHGTHVAGIASASTDNGIGIAGIGFNCKIMCVKVQGNIVGSSGGGGIRYGIWNGYQGIVYAADNGADIINCSWGTSVYSRANEEMINYAFLKGALVVASAGNSNSSGVHYPASYEKVLSVAATDREDVKIPVSNFGSTVDISAPGVDIYSTWKGETYQYFGGTSMASPCVAGVAALVKSYFPDYTAEQVREKVRLTADDINGINPSYAGQLGFGRVNAYRALTKSTPAVRLTTLSIDDKTYGNGNDIYEQGERILLTANFQNYLNDATNVAVSLSTSLAYVKVVKGNLSIGELQGSKTFDGSNNKFEIIVDNATPSNSEVALTFTITADGFKDKYVKKIIINPTYSTTRTGRISLSLGNTGNIGFNDYPDNIQGEGFVYNNDGRNLMYEGSLMLGVSKTQVEDAARELMNTKNKAFSAASSVVFNYSGVSDEDVEASYSDINFPNRLGIKITQKSYAYKNYPDNSYIIVKYNLKNTSGKDIKGLYSGLFLDWDIGSGDIVRFEKDISLGYVHTIDNDTALKHFSGAALLDTKVPVNFWPILNSKDDYWGIYDGFTFEKKFEALSSGIKRDSAGPGDVSCVIGYGPIDISADGSENLVFVFSAGYSLSELKEAIIDAKEKVLKMGLLDIPAVDQSVPLTYKLFANYPNPFNPSTNIKFVMKDKGAVRIQIYDVVGKMVKEVYRDNIKAGEGSITLDMKSCATGVYYFKFTAFNLSRQTAFTKNGKIMLMK